MRRGGRPGRGGGRGRSRGWARQRGLAASASTTSRLFSQMEAPSQPSPCTFSLVMMIKGIIITRGAGARTRLRGASICEHNRERSESQDSGGASICEHNRQRGQCKDCRGASICEHNRVRGQCKDCGGASICEHNRQRSQRKDCGGASICESSGKNMKNDHTTRCDHTISKKWTFVHTENVYNI